MAEAWREFLLAWGMAPPRRTSTVSLTASGSSFGHYSGPGKLSGLKLEDMRTDVAALVHIRDGKVTRLVLYADRDRALADLGLEG